MTLSEIKEQPTLIDNIHESCFRAYHILEQVLTMVERGDTKETIFDVVQLLKINPIEKSIPKCT